jgi:hypothetical protein
MKDYSRNLADNKDYFLSARFLGLVGIALLVTTIVLIFGGFGAMFIIQGLLFIIFRLSAFWKPANRLLGKFSIPYSEKLNTWGWRKWIMIFLLSIPELLFVATGIWILYTLGFDRQNFIYLLLFK